MKEAAKLHIIMIDTLFLTPSLHWRHSLHSWIILLWVTYLLTPWSRVILEKLTGSAARQEIPRIFGTRRFLTVLTSARHLSLSWANSIQSLQLSPTSWTSILILSSHLRMGLPSGLFPSGFLTRTLCTPLLSRIRATCPTHLIFLDFTTRTILGKEYRSLRLCTTITIFVAEQAQRHEPWQFFLLSVFSFSQCLLYSVLSSSFIPNCRTLTATSGNRHSLYLTVHNSKSISELCDTYAWSLDSCYWNR